MPLEHVSYTYGTEDAKIAKLTADPAGGTATYGSLVDVPGIKFVTIAGTVNRKELRGDHQLLAALSKLTDVTVAFEYAKLSLDALAVFFDTTVTDAGTTPNQTSTWDLDGDNDMNFFGFTAKVAGADFIGGDVHFTFPKCQLDAFPSMGTAEEDFRTSSTSAIAMPRLADNRWIRVAFNETEAVLAIS